VQPGQPGAAGGPTVPAGEDKDWVSLAWDIDMKALDKAFEAAGIRKWQQGDQQDPYRTQFLRVWLVREEQNESGQWDAKTQVVIPQQPLVESMPFPSDGDPTKGYEYKLWSVQMLGHLLRPAFPEVSGGDPWYYPGTPKPAQGQTVPGGIRAPMPAPGPGGPAPAAPPGRFPFGQPVGAVPLEGNGFAIPVSGRVPLPQPGRQGNPFPPPVYQPQPAPTPPPVGGFPPPTGYQQPGFDPSANVGGQGGVPGQGSQDGMFNLQMAAQQIPTFEFWTHDLTAQPGKTYRYTVRYAILNPVWQQTTAAPEKLTKQFALMSPNSQPSDEVQIPLRMEFFVRVITPKTSTAQLDLFTWKEGGWTVQAITVVPGDPIGDSKWVVVDVRSEGRDNARQYVLVADPNSQLQRRTIRQDEQSERYQQLKMLAGVPPPGGAPVGPGGPGAPGVGPGVPAPAAPFPSPNRGGPRPPPGI
jgi:hypothetical protein